MTSTKLPRLLRQRASSAPMMQGMSCRQSGKSLTGQRLSLNFRCEWVTSSRQALLMGTAPSLMLKGWLPAGPPNPAAVLGEASAQARQALKALSLSALQGQERVTGSAGAACQVARAAA